MRGHAGASGVAHGVARKVIMDNDEEQYPPAVPRPCKECPWRRDSSPGHLGPYDAETWVLAAHGESPIACHETIKHNDQPWSELKQCRGAATFRANVFKSPRRPDVAVGPRDTVTVFETNQEFIAHHDQARQVLNRMTVRELREEAWLMPNNSRARKAEIITWLLRNAHPLVRKLMREAEQSA